MNPTRPMAAALPGPAPPLGTATVQSAPPPVLRLPACQRAPFRGESGRRQPAILPEPLPFRLHRCSRLQQKLPRAVHLRSRGPGRNRYRNGWKCGKKARCVMNLSCARSAQLGGLAAVLVVEALDSAFGDSEPPSLRLPALSASTPRLASCTKLDHNWYTLTVFKPLYATVRRRIAAILGVRRPVTALKPLHAAVQADDLDQAERLLVAGMSVESRDDQGKTALHLAAELTNIRLVELLAGRGSVVNAKDASGRTPLHAAVVSGDLASVKCLVGNWANIHAEDKDGKTPLDLAAQFGHVEIANMLEFLAKLRGATFRRNVRELRSRPYYREAGLRTRGFC